MDLGAVMKKLLNHLNERGRQVMLERFDLDGKGERTLEEIGHECGITRERIRQIQAESLKKLKLVAKEQKEISSIIAMVAVVLKKHGGAMSEKDLLDALFGKNVKESYIEVGGIKFELPQDNVVNRRIFSLILNINDSLLLEKESEYVKRFWTIDEESNKLVLEIIKAAKNFLETRKKPADIETILKEVNSRDEFKEKNIDIAILTSYLNISKEISQNPFGVWGITEWEEITPKGVRGKIYLVLKNNTKPLHFNDITKMINEISWPDEKIKTFKKIAKSETVHNELIKDKRFVLIGRGTYALSEWGYEPGTVLDVILKVFAKTERPMSKEEIVKEVMSERMVKNNTIIFNLHNSKRFERKGDLYRLKTDKAPEKIMTQKEGTDKNIHETA